jgi:uncharacterized protein
MNRAAEMASPSSVATPGPLDLLVIQPTPFCNLDCRYCYLPDRGNKGRISDAVLDRTFQRVFESDLVHGPFTVVWHAGEPMVLPPSFYAKALAVMAHHNRAGVPVTHSFQTNGTLIDQQWCDFIRQHDLRIGVSVDGPDFLNDAVRTTRRGAGTHRRIMDGIARLRAKGISFHVITVLTRQALDYPDELYAFYVDHGIRTVAFNIEEIEGPHEHSSLSAAGAEDAFRRFMARFLDLVVRGGHALQVREFHSTLAAILDEPDEATLRTQETAPFAIVAVDYQGNFSSFSPELLGLRSARYGDFTFGNVFADSLASAARSPRCLAVSADIAAGIERCRQSCAYFRFCGGGAPVNKYFENGSFDSTETLFCRLNRKALVDVVLDQLQTLVDAPQTRPLIPRGSVLS